MRKGLMPAKKIKIGIIANEFFDENFGGFGGFGWLAREVVFSIKKSLDNFEEPVFLSGISFLRNQSTTGYGIKVIVPDDDWKSYVKKIRGEQIDLLISIDYRPNYDYPLAALPGIPYIFWIQDPRPLEDIEKINSLKIPGKAKMIEGIKPIDCTSFKEVVSQALQVRRKIFYTCPAPTLLEKARKTFGIPLIESEIIFLPYPLDGFQQDILKSSKPKVVFLGRLDPIKRPWIFTELAKYFPEVEFLLLGKSHFEGEGAWSPVNLPENVKTLGHTDGLEKQQILSSSWILINTSIHEALPVSFLEGLQHEMPLLSCQNPENIVSLFGSYTGRFDGDGLDSIIRFKEELEFLLADNDSRKKMGKQGRAWVDSHHSREIFISVLDEIIKNLHPHDLNIVSGTSEPWGFPLINQEILKICKDLKINFPIEQFLLVDDHQIPSHHLTGFRWSRFFENNGDYYGPPSDSKSAIEEFKSQYQSGYNHIVFTTKSSWWLEYYKEFEKYLQESAERIIRSPEFIAFKIQTTS